jgi:hypothetical protein
VPGLDQGKEAASTSGRPHVSTASQRDRAIPDASTDPNTITSPAVRACRVQPTSVAIFGRLAGPHTSSGG